MHIKLQLCSKGSVSFVLDINSYFQEKIETQEINNTEDIVNAGNDTADEKSAVASEEISNVTEETEQKISESEENKEKVPQEAEESEEEESE